LVGGFERSFARGSLDAVVLGIGGEMLAKFEDGFEFVVCADSTGELRGRKGVSALLGEIIQDPMLEIDDGGSGFLASFNTWLMIGVDIDERGVKTDGAFKKSDEKTDRKRRNFLYRYRQ